MAVEDYEQFKEKCKTLSDRPPPAPVDLLKKEPENQEEQKIIIPAEAEQKPARSGGIEIVKEKPSYIVNTEGK